MQATTRPSVRAFAAAAATGVTLAWVTALVGLANHYAEAAASGSAFLQARGDSPKRPRAAVPRPGAENLACKPVRQSAG